MSALVILNPYSGRWAGQARRPEVERALSEAGVEHRLAVTQVPGQATRLAREAVLEGHRPIVVAGGDGTIGEVVNGLAQAAGEGAWAPLGILPLGSANDLVDNLRLPRDLAAAARVVAAENARMLDVCQANDRYFVNNAGLGLEPTITLIQQRIQRVRGILRYVIAALIGISRNPSWEMSLHWDSGSYRGPVTVVSVGNCARTGGVFYTVPHAEPFDGALSFVHGYLPTRRAIVRVLPSTMKSDRGNYVEHPAVHEHHTTRLRVAIQPPTPAHADGEILGTELTSVTYRILPGRLPLLMGA